MGARSGDGGIGANGAAATGGKGYVTHTVDGRTYVYDVAASRGRVAARAVKRIVDRVCDGSVEEVLVGMVDSNMIDWKRLRQFTDKFAARKPGGR